MFDRLLLLVALSAIVFAAFENCPNQEEFDSCADIEIDRIMTNTTVMEMRDVKEAEYHAAMTHCWMKHCV
ncbi:hypothetical protein PRIPAC_73963 [Pristionchus pacificus]|uniref:Uncharacterized protein n=1 Tax=Pristionchus pacificus TaxID=54126 RepID=A0A2A6BFQ4_PRIPA|nr:hypothetical protein PRIPAC_73963 [Pristionchus pacificus]|eukprot:PDM64712.1 hypothetical protein PRIPAC_52968 [Pristionchus pacificus]